MHRASQKKLNGEILMRQADLMSKLAAASQPKRPKDELGFFYSSTQSAPDALQDLLARSKDITKTHEKQINQVKMTMKMSKNKGKEGTFLTGVGLTHNEKQIIKPHEDLTFSEPGQCQQSMLKALEGEDDGLAELRRMIKETGSSLEGCSRKLNKSKKYIMQVADRYTNELQPSTLNFLSNYKQFELKSLGE